MAYCLSVINLLSINHFEKEPKLSLLGHWKSFSYNFVIYRAGPKLIDVTDVHFQVFTIINKILLFCRDFSVLSRLSRQF